MSGLLKTKVNLGFVVNPFYLYCLAFSMAIFVYLWGWSDIFPKLSVSLLLFFAFSFILFIIAGYKFGQRNLERLYPQRFPIFLNDIMFGMIVFLGLLNVILMGYLPILDRTHNYREFGAPVIDPVFNTLSIFFSVFFLQSFLNNKRKRLLVYVFIILVIQILLFRRSTIVWIFTSCTFLLLSYYRRISLLFILAFIICIPLFSYSFGLYGNTRSNLTKSIVLDDLGASDAFKKTGISYNHYITYLYISSPLANLQKNIDEQMEILNSGDFKGLLFFSLIPESFTMRLKNAFKLIPPNCSLITPELIVGTFFMVSFYTMGWPGMVIMLLFLFAFIMLCLFLSDRWNTFQVTLFCILSTAVSLLIFSNFLNRLDVVMMLFIYPVAFHFIYTRAPMFFTKRKTMNAK